MRLAWIDNSYALLQKLVGTAGDVTISSLVYRKILHCKRRQDALDFWYVWSLPQSKY